MMSRRESIGAVLVVFAILVAVASAGVHQTSGWFPAIGLFAGLAGLLVIFGD